MAPASWPRPFALRHESRLANHDGIVDEHPQNQDEADERDAIDRHVEAEQQKHGAQKGDRNAGRNPQCEVRPEEKGEDDEHEQEGHQAAVEQRAEAVLDCHGLVVPDRQFHVLRIPAARLGHIAANLLCDLPQVLAADLRDAHQRRRPAVEAQVLTGIGEAVHHPRHVLEPHLGAVAPGRH